MKSNTIKSNQIKSYVGFWGEGRTAVQGEKPLGAEQRTNKTQPSNDTRSGNQTQASLVEGKRSHDYAILAPPLLDQLMVDFVYTL